MSAHVVWGVIALVLMACSRHDVAPVDSAAALDHPAEVALDDAPVRDNQIDGLEDATVSSIDTAPTDELPLDVEPDDRADVTMSLDREDADLLDRSMDVRDVPGDRAADTPRDAAESTPVFDASGPAAVYAMREIEVVRVFAGNDITMATDRDGSLWAWGSNRYVLMQPGDWNDLYRFDDRRTRPQRITEHLDVRQITLKGITCALVVSERMGSVYCWGGGAMETYGGPTPSWDDWRLPRRMGTFSDVLTLRDYSAMLRSDHSIWAIAAYDSGTFRSTTLASRIDDALEDCYRLTDGTIQETDERYYDTSPQHLNGITSISAGLDHVCMLRNDGHVWCWGNNLFGQAGRFDESDVCYDRSDPSRPTFSNCVRQPREITGLTEVVKVSAGGGISCAVKRDGTVWCWGYNHRDVDGLGDIGDGRVPDEQCVPFQVVSGVRREYPDDAQSCRRHPVQLVGIHDAIDVSVGLTHFCVVRTTGQVLCWGSNLYGQLGDGTRVDRSTPTPVRWY